MISACTWHNTLAIAPNACLSKRENIRETKRSYSSVPGHRQGTHLSLLSFEKALHPQQILFLECNANFTKYMIFEPR